MGNNIKFTFKKYRPTGPYAVFEAEHHDIKVKKKIVGSIDEVQSRGRHASSKDVGRFVVRFIVKCTEHPGWKWIRLKLTYETAREAKDAVKKYESVEQLISILHPLDD